MTEEHKQETHAKLLDSVKDVEKENEILHGKISVQAKALTKQHEMITELDKMQKRIMKDLELTPSTYRNETTRSVAFDAFNQSTVRANWEGLGNHHVIKNVYQMIEDRRAEDVIRADGILTRFEKQPNAREFLEQLKNSWFYKELKEELANLEKIQDSTISTVRNDRTHANQQDLKVRDQIADIHTAMDALEFLGSERELTYDAALMFEIGAWARSGYSAVAEGLREILKKPKEEETEKS